MQSFSLETALYGRPTAKEEKTRWIFSPPQAGKFLGSCHVKYKISLRKNASLEMNFEKNSASRRAISHRDFSEPIPLAMLKQKISINHQCPVTYTIMTTQRLGDALCIAVMNQLS